MLFEEEKVDEGDQAFNYPEEPQVEDESKQEKPQKVKPDLPKPPKYSVDINDDFLPVVTFEGVVEGGLAAKYEILT